MQSTDYLSSRSTTNQNWLDDYLTNPRWRMPPAKTTPYSSDEAEEHDDQSLSQMTGSPRSSVGGRQRSSYFSAGSRFPATPSPIPSPACSSSRNAVYQYSPTPGQSSCITASRRKFKPSGDAPAAAEMDGRRPSTARHRPPPMRSTRGIEASYVKPTRTPKSHHRDRSVAPVRRSFAYEPRGGSPFICNGYGRLPVVNEEEWRRERERGRHRAAMSRHSWTDDGYCAGSSGNGRGYETSDIEREFGERLESVGKEKEKGRPFSGIETKSRRKEIEDRLAALREARIMELKNKLREEEAAIDLREKKQIAKAKMDMKEVELKLEKTRDAEMDKMQRRIRCAQKEAKNMKIKEKEATDKKITKATEEFDEMAITGKVSWRFICI